MQHGNATDFIAGIVGAIVSVAILSVIFSRQGQTANVIKAFGDALASVLKTVLAPVSGG
jgi:uncharacterized membrane protein YeaQ/YmgE (transglycosylase-associated protein family)